MLNKTKNITYINIILHSLNSCGHSVYISLIKLNYNVFVIRILYY